MDRGVVWSDPGLEDLAAAAEYFERDLAYYAASFVQRILEAAEHLTGMADRGQIVSEFENPAVREFLVYPYRLMYHLEAGKVTVLAVVHGALRKDR